MDSSPLAAGTIFDGTYEILSLIDSGGMGSVYRARHIHLQHECAIKVLGAKKSASSSPFQRFRREAQVLSSLSHPNIVSCSSFGIGEGRCYLVMDLIQGISLREAIAKDGPLTEQRFRHIFQQVLDAVAHAHSQGIVHRDLKPENIMLTGESGDTVRIIDFGIAKLQAEEGANLALTKTGEILGSPHFMSPEQCSGGTIDERTDLYSIACVMYFALTGKIAFASDNLFEVVQCHISQPFPALPNDVAKPIRMVVQTATEKVPSKRYRSAAEMKNALDSTAGGSIDVTGVTRGFAGLGLASPRVLIALAIGATLLLAGGTWFMQNRYSSSSDQSTSKLQHDYEALTKLRKKEADNGHEINVERVSSVLVLLKPLFKQQMQAAENALERNDRVSASTYLGSARQNIQIYKNTFSYTPELGYEAADTLFAVAARLSESQKKNCALDACRMYEKEFERYPQPDYALRLDKFERLINSLDDSKPLARAGFLTSGAVFAYKNSDDARSKRLASDAAKLIVASKPDSAYFNTRNNYVVSGLDVGRPLINIGANAPAIVALEAAVEVGTKPQAIPVASSAAYWKGVAKIASEPKSRDAEEALHLSAEIAEKHDYNAVLIYALLARHLREQGKLKEAKGAAELALAQDDKKKEPPNLSGMNIDPRFELAAISLEASQPDKAVAMFDRFVKENQNSTFLESWMTPSNMSAQALLSYRLSHGGKSPVGAKLIKTAQNYLLPEIDKLKNSRIPSQRSAVAMDCFLLAFLHWQQGSKDLSETWMSQALVHLPGSDLGWERQGQLLSMQAEVDYWRGRWQRCVAQCLSSLHLYKLVPSDTPERMYTLARLNVMLGASLKRLGRTARAESALRDALRYANLSKLDKAKEQARHATNELSDLLKQ